MNHCNKVRKIRREEDRVSGDYWLSLFHTKQIITKQRADRHKNDQKQIHSSLQ